MVTCHSLHILYEKYRTLSWQYPNWYSPVFYGHFLCYKKSALQASQVLHFTLILYIDSLHLFSLLSSQIPLHNIHHLPIILLNSMSYQEGSAYSTKQYSSAQPFKMFHPPKSHTPFQYYFPTSVGPFNLVISTQVSLPLPRSIYQECIFPSFPRSSQTYTITSTTKISHHFILCT